MGIYTSEYLIGLANQKQKLFEENLSIIRKIKHTEFDIFISHSFLDKKEIQGLYIELTNFGYSVYVDWVIDPHLDRENVTKESAELIRARMKSSKSILLAISFNASISKWMPWELGYIDGNTKKCAIIPVSKEKIPPKFFKRTEYLLLYPFIKKLPTKHDHIERLWVIEDKFKYSRFETWFQNGSIHQDNKIDIFNL